MAAALGEREIAEFVEHNEVHTGQIIGEPALTTGAGFALQPVDEVDDSVETATGAAADTSPRNSDSEMAFAGAGSAELLIRVRAASGSS